MAMRTEIDLECLQGENTVDYGCFVGAKERANAAEGSEVDGSEVT